MVMAKKETGYEELRRQRLEENKKRMEELHLPRLSLALKSSSPKPSLKPSPMKRVKRTEMVEVRRSGRVANLPAPIYKEIVSYGRFDIPRRIHGYKRDLSNRVYASDEARASAALKAEELESSLGADYPTLVKPMLQSHVTRFSMCLPGYWCRSHLPKRDDTVTLIDEEGEEYPTLYLSRKSELTCGWRGFSIAHGLVAGDALVLQLIRPTAFKVYIIRVKGFEKGIEARASATLKAEELESSLGAEYPTFVIPMLQSHVTGGFWLGLPGYWCRRHLPTRANTVTLIDEEGEEYPTLYLSTKSGLSDGWRGFSIAHGLVDGDALVFQLIRPTAFKVYILRVKGFEKGSNLEDIILPKQNLPMSSNLKAKMVMAKKETRYEELRRQRLEENKKRMEELHLPQLSLALKSSSCKPSLKTKPMKRVKRTEMVEVRRSSRVANLPDPVYKEIVYYEDIPRRIHGYNRDLSNWVYASDEARASATLKAEELESSLGADYPTFVKPMLQSHVTGFWLGLPGYWCRAYLPKRDDTVTLIDEEGEEYPTMYMSTKSGLSGGWRVFSIAHGLVDGDALVFQLIRPTAFKVFIIRVKGFEKGSNLEDIDVPILFTTLSPTSVG